MGKCCLHASLFIFDRIIIQVAGNQNRHKSSDEFDFGAGSDYSLWSYLPLNDKLYTSKLEYLSGQLANLDQILCVASRGVGKGCIMFWGRLDQIGVHGNRKPPLIYNRENGVFYRLLLIGSFLYPLQTLFMMGYNCFHARPSVHVSVRDTLVFSLYLENAVMDIHQFLQTHWYQ